MRKAIILLSGGVDSTTCLALAKEEYDEIIAVSIDYGQTHKRELEAAEKICQYYKTPHKVIDLKDIFKSSKSSLNANSGITITEGDYKDQTLSKQINTEVEFRNGIFISIMASLALQFKAEAIFYGAHKDDSGAIYADCSDEFIDKITELVSIGTKNKVSLITPFKNYTKADIVKKGLELNVPYKLTYSCYKGGEKPCGKCGTCIDRKKAFKANGIYDIE